MRVQVGLILVIGLVIGSVGPTRGAEKKWAKGLEGTWVVVSFTRDGKKDASPKGDKVTFEGKNLTLKTKRGEEKATFTIDPRTQAIDLTVNAGGRKETIKGIFRVKGNELKVCHSQPGQDRPKHFTAAKDSGNTLIVLKRDKSK
jgi:uncharacterized protein (TIGR03067 family)